MCFIEKGKEKFDVKYILTDLMHLIINHVKYFSKLSFREEKKTTKKFHNLMPLYNCRHVVNFCFAVET